MFCQIGWSRGNALDAYSVGVQFESRPGQPLSWLRFSWTSSVPLGKCWERTSITPRPFLCTSSFNRQPIVRRYAVSALKALLNKMRKTQWNSISSESWASERTRRNFKYECYGTPSSYFILSEATASRTIAFRKLQYLLISTDLFSEQHRLYSQQTTVNNWRADFEGQFGRSPDKQTYSVLVFFLGFKSYCSDG